MIELRWVPPLIAESMSSDSVVTEDSSLMVLQYRYFRTHRICGNSATELVDFSNDYGWSEWKDVPTVTACAAAIEKMPLP